jgi:hypothetical protein
LLIESDGFDDKDDDNDDVIIGTAKCTEGTPAASSSTASVITVFLLSSSMNLLLDYQQIIIKSTYERNNVAFAPAADCATSLRALMRMLRRDMESFVAAGEKKKK